METLFVTFGYKTEGILAPMRKLGYGKIIVVTGKENLTKDGYLALKKFLPPHEVLEVDVFDFWDCVSKMQGRIKECQDLNQEVKVAASGGTHILFSAAILAAWATGAKCHFLQYDLYGEIPILPINAVKLILEKDDRKILKSLPEKRISYLKLKTLGKCTEKEIQESIDRLATVGLVEIRQGERPFVMLTEKGKVARELV